MVQSHMLTEFYQDWKQWIDEGAEVGKFWRTEGLCLALARWCKLHSVPHFLQARLGVELGNQFGLAGLSSFIPFNPIRGSYIEESNQGACHLNSQRVQWVKDHT